MARLNMEILYELQDAITKIIECKSQSGSDNKRLAELWDKEEGFFKHSLYIVVRDSFKKSK